MKKILFIFVCLAWYPLLNAQDIVASQATLDSIYEPKLAGDAYFAKQGLLGSQFYNDEWAEGDIYLMTGETIFNKLLKYNGLIDELIWLTPETFKQVKIDKFSIDKFLFKNLHGQKVWFKRINTKKPLVSDSTDIFAELNVEGKISLYIQRRIAISGSVDKDHKGGIYSYNELDPSPVYYLKLPNGTFTSLNRLNKHSLLKIFPDQKPAIRKLLRQNHQPLENEYDLGKAIRLLNNQFFN